MSSTTPTPAPTSAPLLTFRDKAEIVAAIAFFLSMFAYGSALHAERSRRLTAEATEKTLQAEVADDKKQIADLQLEDQARDKAAADQVQKLQAAAAAAQSPAQVVKFIHDQVSAGAPAPIDVSIPKATPANPSPDAIAEIPQVDLPFLRNEISNCSIDAVKVPDLSGDLTSCQAQLKLAGEELSAMQKERDGWKTAAKGGTWAQRIKSGAIKVGVGIAIGVAADEAARHH